MIPKNVVSYINKVLIFKNSRVIARNISALHDTKVKTRNQAELNKLVAKYKDLFYYSSFLDDCEIDYGYKRIKTEKFRKKIKARELGNKDVLPLSLRLLNKDLNVKNFDEILNERIHDEKKLGELKLKQPQEDSGNCSTNWLHDYENYTEGLNKNIETADLCMESSKIPCGGCGALLHCEDSNKPGYIPPEIYHNSKKSAGIKLHDLVCQRCHFLKTYNQALNVEVTPNDYLRVLSKVYSHEKSLVILLVDLLDFPCSVWPGIHDLIGFDKKLFVVGNKVDLLPINDVKAIHHVKDVLYRSVVAAGVIKENIEYVSLVSAKTGYGVEDLITNLFSLWRYKGDVILIGCTNVGKSTLFNTLINSDYCKYYTSDIIQRATTSSWPGTTINLLKFPILKLGPERYQERCKKVMALQKLQKNMAKFSQTQVEKERHKFLIPSENYIASIFKNKEREDGDLFAVSSKVSQVNETVHVLDEDSTQLKMSRWFYDTPGVVQPEQITDLLTMEELELLFPKEIIKPKTFSMRPNSSIFIADLARLDYLEGAGSVRFTVFCSAKLPITICSTSDASQVYKTFLGTELLGIPGVNNKNFKSWPELIAGDNFVVEGIHRHKSCADIVLSSAGWVSITPNHGVNCTVRAWTPGKKGIYLREALLPRAVYYRGKRLKYSCAYSGNFEK